MIAARRLKWLLIPLGILAVIAPPSPLAPAGSVANWLNLVIWVFTFLIWAPVGVVFTTPDPLLVIGAGFLVSIFFLVLNHRRRRVRPAQMDAQRSENFAFVLGVAAGLVIDSWFAVSWADGMAFVFFGHLFLGVPLALGVVAAWLVRWCRWAPRWPAWLAPAVIVGIWPLCAYSVAGVETMRLRSVLSLIAEYPRATPLDTEVRILEHETGGRPSARAYLRTEDAFAAVLTHYRQRLRSDGWHEYQAGDAVWCRERRECIRGYEHRNKGEVIITVGDGRNLGAWPRSARAAQSSGPRTWIEVRYFAPRSFLSRMTVNR